MKLQGKSTSGIAKIRQLWKIKYIDDGYYSIRSLYKSDRCIQVASNTAKLLGVSTSDTLSAIPAEARWKIEAVSSGYTFQNCGTTSSKQCMRPSGTSVVTSTYVSGNTNFTWTLTADTSVAEQLLLINTQTGQTVTNAVALADVGDVVRASDINLEFSFVSRLANQTSYYWLSGNSDVATVGRNDGKVTVVGPGKATISVRTYNSNIAPVSYTIDVSLVSNGTYYIRNWEINKYIEISDTTVGLLIYGNKFQPNQSSQQWDITYLGDESYAIRSKLLTGYYLGVANDSSQSGALIVPRTGNFTNGMKWKIQKTSRGGYKIRALTTSNDLVLTPDGTQSYCDLKLQPFVDGDASYEWLFCAPNTEIIHEKQETDKWCWVTCARMASSLYMKSPITQASAAVYTHMNGARTLLPNMDQNAPALEYGTAIETSAAMEYILGWEDSTYHTEAMEKEYYPKNVLLALLDAGNVVIAGRQTNSESGHACLVYDYSYNSTLGDYQFHIYDPLYDDENSSVLRSYEWLRNGNNGLSSEPKDGRIWSWVVTYCIGPYSQTTEL